MFFCLSLINATCFVVNHVIYFISWDVPKKTFFSISENNEHIIAIETLDSRVQFRVLENCDISWMTKFALESSLDTKTNLHAKITSEPFSPFQFLDFSTTQDFNKNSMFDIAAFLKRLIANTFGTWCTKSCTKSCTVHPVL